MVGADQVDRCWLKRGNSGKGRGVGEEDLIGPVLHQWGRELLLTPRTGFLNLPLNKGEGSTFIKPCVPHKSLIKYPP